MDELVCIFVCDSFTGIVSHAYSLIVNKTYPTALPPPFLIYLQVLILYFCILEALEIHFNSPEQKANIYFQDVTIISKGCIKNFSLIFQFL